MSQLDATLLEVGPANVYIDDGSPAPGLLLGFMGDELAVTMSTEVSILTGAQRGTVPLDKVVSGGFFRVTVPFKEISLENLQLGFPNSELFILGGTRVDFKPKVGLSMLSLAKKMTIIKLIGGVESLLAEDTLVIPLASPSDTEVVFPYHPTEQRIILATFEAFPDPANNDRWAFMGDEAAS